MCISTFAFRTARTSPRGGRLVFLPCKQCWQCIRDYKLDWVGRCIAEHDVAVASHVVTLDYSPQARPDPEAAKTLVYGDVQKWLKLLRRHDYPLRYFIVGEHGAKNGRAHWHAVTFWQSQRIPKMELRETFWNDAYWPHGHAFWDEVSVDSLRYVCKYLLKEDKRSELYMSRRPPLGDGYFRKLAQDYVDQGISPQNGYYYFPEVTTGNKKTPFYMRGVTRDNFCGYFKAAWEAKHGAAHYPASDFMQEYEDASCGYEPFDGKGEPKVGKYPYRTPWERTPNGVEPYFSDRLNSWFCTPDPASLPHFHLFWHWRTGEWRSEIEMMDARGFPRDETFHRLETREENEALSKLGAIYARASQGS
ncbi:MAG: replication initiator protein [Microviridae sp.]|nr:MAG: replication initiator protein [Microviridae sp.]